MAKQLELFPEEELQPQDIIETPEQKVIEDAEWCFQFFNNEPMVFGWQEIGTEPTPLVLQLNPIENEVMTFRQNGMEFKIFARPITKETKLLRLEQDENKNKEVKS
jgi:hypothetical protein